MEEVLERVYVCFRKMLAERLRKIIDRIYSYGQKII